jgi:CubicO group peptidase (beta-lactamase class C family)
MKSHKNPIAALLAAILLTLAGPAHAQQADRFPAVAPRMQEFVDKGEVAGVVTLVATRDKVIHLAAVGKTDLSAVEKTAPANDRRMRADDIFWIASMSKPIT